MSDKDPWDWLNFRYANDDVARFEIVLDGVEAAAERLQSENVAELRLALVIVDYLADVLLARRVSRLIRLSEQGFAWERREQFDSKTRGLLRQGFNRRVTLAARPYDASFTFGLGDPILDEDEAEVLRVAHAYRNDVYHEDRHPMTIRPLTATALHVVVRAWKASLPANIGSSWGAKSQLMDRLRRKGYISPECLTADSLSLHAGAEAVGSWLDRTLPIDLRAHRRKLASDIETRVAWAESMVDWLSGFQGPGTEHIDPALRWHEFWRRHGDDPELVALDTRRRSVFEQLSESEGDKLEHLRDELRRCEAVYVARLRYLQAAYEPEVSLAALPQFLKRGRGLRQAKTMGALLGRYRTLDMDARVIEDALADVAIGWDEHVERESDRAGGRSPAIIWTDDDGVERKIFLD